MTPDDYQKVSFLIEATRAYVSSEMDPEMNYPSLFKSLKNSVNALSHLLIEGDVDPFSDSKEPAYVSAGDDALLQQAAYVRVLESDYASLKRLYEIRLEVCAKEVKALKEQIRQESES